MGQRLANANQKVLLNLGTDVEVNHKLVEERCSRSVQNMAYIGNCRFSSSTRGRAGLDG